MNILVTGGLGYIGSHTCISLVEAGYQPIVLDNLSNSSVNTHQRLETLLEKAIPFYCGDVRDHDYLDHLFSQHTIGAVIHFAGLKSVAESVLHPLMYYENNVEGSIHLCAAMKRANVRQLIFSSSATVYGEPKYLPYDEAHPLNPINPYGRSKRQVEEILLDHSIADPQLHIAALRYFNPVGAHSSGAIGENPSGTPNNLMPYLARVAVGQYPFLRIFGQDFDTRDGTGERDYIHVMDLAEGHVATLNFLNTHPGYHEFNLGSGKSHSVLEVVRVFEEASNRKIPLQMMPRRDGDLAAYYALPTKANTLLQWRTQRDLKQMCETAWNFQWLELNKNTT